jgi:geranylgeranyl reductase family protein
MKYDVIVVGAGPAGATTAYRLARKGIRTLLIEKDHIPRYKACGGGLTPQIKRVLDFDYSPVVERVVTQVTFLSPKKQLFTRYLHGIGIEMTSRTLFDSCLVEKAVISGVKLIESMRIASIVENGKNVIVRSGNGESWQGSIVVGADGVNSIVAKSSGLEGESFGIALESELYPSNGEFLEKFENRAFFEFNILPEGYGWIFPKKDHFSVGVGSAQSRHPKISTVFEKFKEQFSFLKNSVEKIRRGCFLPYNQGPRVINSARVCLVGDAASLVDPFTGEGIYHAIHSGFLASDIIYTELQKDGQLSGTYTHEINSQIVENFYYAKQIANIFFRYPSFFYRNDEFFTLFMRMMKGELSYRDLFFDINKKYAGQLLSFQIST